MVSKKKFHWTKNLGKLYVVCMLFMVCILYVASVDVSAGTDFTVALGTLIVIHGMFVGTLAVVSATDCGVCISAKMWEKVLVAISVVTSVATMIIFNTYIRITSILGIMLMILILTAITRVGIKALLGCTYVLGTEVNVNGKK